MLHLTDIHLQYWIGYRHQKLIRTIRRLQPDIILITGDMVDQFGNPKLLDKFLPLLPADSPKVAILGNHDHKADHYIQNWRGRYQSGNVDLLVNESKVYWVRGIRLMVTGLDDFIESQSDAEKALADVGREEHHFLLIHSPTQ